MNIQEVSCAVFSDCRNYRYSLWRVWDNEKPLVAFIGLNPSTANETKNDPTIRRVVQFAQDWNFGGVCMLNLFAIVSADPSILKTHHDPIKDNDASLVNIGGRCGAVVFAWGNFKEATERAKEIVRMFPKAICLGVNKNGTPKHPLYIARKTEPVYFSNQEKYFV
jgi:hypothetical protein